MGVYIEADLIGTAVKSKQKITSNKLSINSSNKLTASQF